MQMSDNLVDNNNKSLNLLPSRTEKERKEKSRENQREAKGTFGFWRDYHSILDETRVTIIKTERSIEENEFAEETVLPSKCVL